MSQDLRQLAAAIRQEEESIRLGGGSKAIDRQHGKGRLTARERIEFLLAPEPAEKSWIRPAPFFELGLWQLGTCMPTGAARRRQV